MVALTAPVSATAAPRGPRFAFAKRADAQIRTGDPFITSEVLYQLSYVGEASTLAASDSNP
jgi:hypothetical protein